MVAGRGLPRYRAVRWQRSMIRSLVEMQEKFSAAQVEVKVRDITSDIGIPTMAAVCR